MKSNAEMVYRWRAVDHEGELLASYMTKTRDKDAALTLMEKAPAGTATRPPSTSPTTCW